MEWRGVLLGGLPPGSRPARPAATTEVAELARCGIAWSRAAAAAAEVGLSWLRRSAMLRGLAVAGSEPAPALPAAGRAVPVVAALGLLAPPLVVPPPFPVGLGLLVRLAVPCPEPAALPIWPFRTSVRAASPAFSTMASRVLVTPASAIFSTVVHWAVLQTALGHVACSRHWGGGAAVAMAIAAALGAPPSVSGCDRREMAVWQVPVGPWPYTLMRAASWAA